MIRLLKLQLLFCVFLASSYGIISTGWAVYYNGRAGVNDFIWIVSFLFLFYLALHHWQEVWCDK